LSQHLNLWETDAVFSAIFQRKRLAGELGSDASASGNIIGRPPVEKQVQFKRLHGWSGSLSLYFVNRKW
jgi:hypothetical protein